jgi:hypothetical protein
MCFQSSAPMHKNHARALKSSKRRLKSTLTTDPTFSANFNINELESALKYAKLRTAAGIEGVYLEFIRNSETKEWLISFINDVLLSARLPKLFKRAIPTPGKDGSDPAHYLPISLLSVMYKLLARLILQCIQPLIETATLVHQARFCKHRGCTETSDGAY